MEVICHAHEHFTVESSRDIDSSIVTQILDRITLIIQIIYLIKKLYSYILYFLPEKKVIRLIKMLKNLNRINQNSGKI